MYTNECKTFDKIITIKYMKRCCSCCGVSKVIYTYNLLHRSWRIRCSRHYFAPTAAHCNWAAFETLHCTPPVIFEHRYRDIFLLGTSSMKNRMLNVYTFIKCDVKNNAREHGIIYEMRWD